MSTIDRRTILKGMLGGAAVSIALPPLEFMMNTNGTAWADGSAFPTRFVMWTWGNGVVPSKWIPGAAGAGDAWQLSAAQQPLAKVKSKLSVVSGTEVRARNTIPHYSGLGPFLTGKTQLGEEGAHTYGGPTIDQIIASEIGGATQYASIETSAWYEEGISHRGPNSPNPPFRDALELFRELFGDSFREPGSDAVVDPTLALRQSVLDVVTGRVKDLQTKLGARDKQRLDAHLSGIRDLEQRIAQIAAGPPDYAACRKPTQPLSRDEMAEDIAVRSRALVDVQMLAFACDLTRVSSHVYVRPVGNYQFADTSDGHHQLTHNEGGDQPTVQANTIRQMEGLAYYLEAMDAIEEGSGSLLDHSVVLACSDVSLGKTHSLDEWPMLVAGSGNGVLKTDVHYRSTTKENALTVPLTLIRAFGINRADFGVDDSYTDASLSALEA